MDINSSPELTTAVELAKSAAKKILQFYALEIIAEEKLGVDNYAEPVTIADRTASKMIVEGLSAAFPEDAILSEEETDEMEIRLSKNRVWMIDPIDGTSGFIKRNGDFGVQIGLTENSVPILGVVLLPAADTLYYAVRGKGTFVSVGEQEPTRLHVSDTSNLDEVVMVSSRNHHSKYLEKIRRNFGISTEIQRGSVGLKIGMIAEREADLYIHTSPRTKFWDTCAPQVILEEAGGKLTDIFGAPLYYDRRDVQNHNGVLASNGVLHEKAVTRLKPLLSEFGRLRFKAKTN